MKILNLRLHAASCRCENTCPDAATQPTSISCKVSWIWLRLLPNVLCGEMVALLGSGWKEEEGIVRMQLGLRMACTAVEQSTEKGKDGALLWKKERERAWDLVFFLQNLLWNHFTYPRILTAPFRGKTLCKCPKLLFFHTWKDGGILLSQGLD